MLFVNLDDELRSDAVGLPPCPGHLSGVRCPRGCLTHYQYGANDVSEILLAVGLFPGSVKWRGWNHGAYGCRSGAGLSVRLYSNHLSFKDAAGDAVAVYCVLINDPADLGVVVRVFTDPVAAQTLCDSTIGDLASDCVCDDAG